MVETQPRGAMRANVVNVREASGLGIGVNEPQGAVRGNCAINRDVSQSDGLVVKDLYVITFPNYYAILADRYYKLYTNSKKTFFSLIIIQTLLRYAPVRVHLRVKVPIVYKRRPQCHLKILCRCVINY